MTDIESMQAQVLAYFRAVDDEDLPALLATLAQDCRFTVETHQVRLQGHGPVSAMFHRLWDHHVFVRHDQFAFVCDPPAGRIAAQFQVTNQLHDGQLVNKSNCNFFTLIEGKFTEISVYMAGENTLDLD